MIRFALHKKLQGASGPLSLDVAYTMADHEMLSLYGPSGAGKTTILRMLAGLLKPDEGMIEVNGVLWYDSRKKIDLSPQKRTIGYVFQERSLFPNMTVRENLLFAAGNSRHSAFVDEMLGVMELQELKDRKPILLSGGQKQRVELARALVRRPAVLLLDEPLSALDYAMRQRLQELVLQVHRDFSLMTILVSHEMTEIAKLSNKVLQLQDGKVVQSGAPADVLWNTTLSGKFQFTGEIVHIDKEDIVYILQILVGNTVVKVVADEQEAKSLSAGDKVLVSSKAFNPLIKKIS
jgi:molybdate transport system ATP-binding protein